MMPKMPIPVPMMGSKPAWWQILRDNGYPTDVVVIDFETYFDTGYTMGGKSADSLSTIEYVMDPRYQELGKAILHIKAPFEQPAPCMWRGDDNSYIEYLQGEYGSNLEGCTTVAQNFGFDGTVLARKYGIYPKFPIDLIGLARHEESRDLNDLESLAERFNLPAKGDIKRFKGWRLETMTPEQWVEISNYACRDDWLEWNLFVRLLPRLSRPRVELALIKHTLEMFTRPALSVDQPFAQELIGKMKAEIDRVVQATGQTKEEISGNISFSGLMGAALDAAGDKLAKYQKANKRGDAILAIAKDDEQLEFLTGHPDQRVRELMAARTGIKSWPLHIGRVERIARQAGASGGLLPVPLKYHGAHTGRWSGGERINLQNLSSRGSDLVNSIRNLLIAPLLKYMNETWAEQVIVMVDAAQIEARVLSWIAGQEDLNEAFRQNRDIYCEFASKMSGRTIRKDRKTDPKPLAKFFKRMRNMGKIGILGGGYGMGADKCQAFAAVTYGVEMTLNESVRLIDTYRKSVPQITKFWRMVEQKFRAAAKYGEPGVMDRGLKFHREEFCGEQLTIITLPSGRQLKYANVKAAIINGRDQLYMPNPMEGNKRIFMWGGYLTENIVQAISRDILAEGILETEEKGYRVALHCHDEIVAVVLKSQGEQALKDISQILSTPPEWAGDCPLGAEGKISTRYEK